MAGYTAAMARVLFFDDGLADLSPLTDTRDASEVRTGGLTTAERVRSMASGAGMPVMCVNGRCPLLPAAALDLSVGEGLVEAESGHLIAVALDEDAALRGGVPEAASTTRVDGRTLLSRPWHWRVFRDACIAHDLASLCSGTPDTATPAGCHRMGGARLCVDPSAQIAPGCVFDLEGGDIWVGPDALIRPGATISGPVILGAGSTVLDHAIIKANTAIGPRCKVAGEIGGTIFQGFANKGHAGHLGDSWVGAWANLGADTTNSNLLNTYGPVTIRCAPDARNESTGETFLGALIADHVKTAIATRLYTGCVLRTGAMYAASAPVTGCVGGFSWVTDKGVSRFRWEKFIDVARTVMARRDVALGAEMESRLRAVYDRETGDA